MSTPRGRHQVNEDYFKATAQSSETTEWGYTYTTVYGGPCGVVVGSSFAALQDELRTLMANRPDATDVKVYSRNLVEAQELWQDYELTSVEVAADG